MIRSVTVAPWVALATAAADTATAAAATASAAGATAEAAAILADAAAQAAAAAVDPGYLAATKAYYKSLEWPIEPAVGAVAFPDLSLPSYAALVRSGVATSIDARGMILETAANTARDSYDPITGQYLGKRIEGRGAANIWLQSNTFNTSPNTVSRATAVANQATGPDGTTSAWFLREDSTANNTHSIIQSISWASGTTYTLAALVKKGTREFCWLGFPAAAFDIVNNNARSAFFDLTTGVPKSDDGNPARNSMQLRDGWWLVWITATATATASGSAGFRMATGTATNNDFYTGDGTSGLYVYSLSVFESAAPAEQIVTTTTAVTVPDETLEFSAISAALSQTSGGMVFRGRYERLAGVAETLMSVDDGTTDEMIRVAKGADEVLFAEVVVGGVSQGTVTLDAVEAEQDFCISAAWGDGELVASMNGAPPITATIAALPTVTDVRLFHDGADGEGFDGYFQNAGLFGVRVDNAQLRNLSQLAAPDRSRVQAILTRLATPLIFSQSRGAITATQPAYGLDLTAVNKFGGSVFLRDSSGNGHVIGVPVTTTNLIDIDVTAQTATLTNYGTTISSGAGSSGTSGGRWIGACRLSSTRAICAPLRATKPLIIDRSAGTIEMPDWQATYGVDLSDSGSPKYTKPIKGFNGKVYFGPSHSHNVMIWDEAAGTCEQTDFGLTTLFAEDKPWGTGVLYPDGRIIYPPFINTCWLVIDTNYATAKVYTAFFGAPPLEPPSSFGSTGSLSGGAVAYTGEVIVPAFDANVCARLDPRYNRVEYSNLGIDITVGKGQWADSNPLPDGGVWATPLDAPLGVLGDGAIFRYDPVTRKATRGWYGLTTWTTGHQYNGGCFADDGYWYAAPYSAQGVLRAGPFALYDEETLMSPYI